MRDAQHAVVTLLARVNGHLMELGVPVYASGSGMAVSTASPPWLARPGPGRPRRCAGRRELRPAAQRALQAQLPAFFEAYASGDAATMARFLARGASVTGLGGAVTFSSISSLYVPAGGETRHITVSVVWQIPGKAGLHRLSSK